VVDADVSHNVARIFELYLSGQTARAIAEVLNKENILTANEYYYSTLGKPNPYKSDKNLWGSATIMSIIKNPVYYGAMANGKKAVKSFKNKKIQLIPFEKWIVVDDTHEPIISKEKWLEAQQLSKNNRKQTVRRCSNGEVSIFAGIIKCADCGGNLVFNRKAHKSGSKEFFRCSTYTQKGKAVCSMHAINYNVIYQAVLTDIQKYAVLAVEDEKSLIDKLLKDHDEFKNKSIQRFEKTMREAKNRIKEIDGLIPNLFEEKIAGTISDLVFKRIVAKYEEEQTKLIADTEQLERELEEAKSINQDVTIWIDRVKKCLTIDCLTRAIVVELIDRVEVSEIYTVDGEKSLDINIFYKFSLKSSGFEWQKNRAV